MINLRISTAAFSRALSAFSENSKKDGATILRQNAKGMVRRVIDVTPPGGKGVSGTKAKQRGEQSVVSDALKVVVGVNQRRAGKADAGPVRKVIKLHRNSKSGRTSTVTPRILVFQADLRRYLIEAKKRVGFLASGWNEAAARLGHRPPAWVWRHAGAGAVDIILTGTRLRIVLTNRVAYASHIDDIRQLMQWAVNAQTNALLRQMRAHIPEMAKRSGL